MLDPTSDTILHQQIVKRNIDQPRATSNHQIVRQILVDATKRLDQCAHIFPRRQRPSIEEEWALQAISFTYTSGLRFRQRLERQGRSKRYRLDLRTVDVKQPSYITASPI